MMEYVNVCTSVGGGTAVGSKGTVGRSPKERPSNAGSWHAHQTSKIPKVMAKASYKTQRTRGTPGAQKERELRRGKTCCWVEYRMKQIQMPFLCRASRHSG